LEDALKNIFKVFLCLLILFIFFLKNSEAALIDRGGGLVYDTALNITWVQNASYINTAGQPGNSTWDGAMAWADQLTYYDSVRNVPWSDWRLPTTINRPIAFLEQFYNTNPTINDEMAYMYYVNLGFKADYSDDINDAPIPVIPTDSPIQNIVFRAYWTGTSSADARNRAWFFHFHQGWESIENPDGSVMGAWAVRDGDVASVPIPGAAFLFVSGLIGIICRKKIFYV
jgi:hypothetical protein